MMICSRFPQNKETAVIIGIYIFVLAEKGIRFLVIFGYYNAHNYFDIYRETMIVTQVMVILCSARGAERNKEKGRIIAICM